MTYTPPAPIPRQGTGPDMSKGQLSAEFTEVEVEVTSSFAHNRGTVSRAESLTVGGKACSSQEVLKELVALRKGWTVAGGSSDQEVKATLEAFVTAWDAAIPNSGRLTGDSLPEHLTGGRVTGPRPSYHPPRVAIYALDDGDKLVVHSYFQTWDGGNHGRQLALAVEAYRVSDGSYFELREPKKSRGQAPEKTGPQPVDPKIPRPQHLTR
jgi:hypothetical protein